MTSYISYIIHICTTSYMFRIMVAGPWEKLPRRRLPQVLASFGGADMEASFRQAPARSVTGIGGWIGWIGWIKTQEVFSVKFFFLKMERKSSSTCCVVIERCWSLVHPVPDWPGKAYLHLDELLRRPSSASELRDLTLPGGRGNCSSGRWRGKLQWTFDHLFFYFNVWMVNFSAIPDKQCSLPRAFYQGSISSNVCCPESRTGEATRRRTMRRTAAPRHGSRAPEPWKLRSLGGHGVLLWPW